MALPKIQITPVNIGAVADDGTGDKLRNAVEKLNSSIASLAEVMEALTASADPELDTFRKVADIIYRYNTIINGLPTPEQVVALIQAQAAPAVAAIPTPAAITQQIRDAAAGVVAELSPSNYYTKTATDALLAVLKGTADAAHDTLGELAALIDANTASAATNATAISALAKRPAGGGSAGGPLLML